MTREEAADMLRHCEAESHCYDGIHGNCKRCNKRIAFDMAIEALKREDHDGCDGCRYEANDELSFPCAECKQNYVDKYVPMPEHDREWIIGCIKHDGFIKTDRGDKANQIILDALSADNTSTNTSTKSTNTPTNTSTKSTNISTEPTTEAPRSIEPTITVDLESGVVPRSAIEKRPHDVTICIGEKKGEWADVNGNPVPLNEDGETANSCWCSECGEWLVASDEYPTRGNFCPNCGADMRGGEDK